MSSTSFLGRYYDPELRLPRAENREQLEDREVDRITNALAVVVVAGSIPRRLGIEASSEELALDKRRARRVAYALNQALRGWRKKAADLNVDDKVRIAGAQLDWQSFAEAHQAEIQTRLRIIVTWSLRHDEERWAKSAVVRLENEVKWISYAMRD